MNQRDLHRPPSGASHAFVARMKYILLLLGVAVIYLVLVRSSPVKEVAQTMASPEVAPLTTGPKEIAAPSGTALKQPIDRTRAVLEQVKARNGNGEF